MDKAKAKHIAFKAVVTFVEGVAGYLAVQPHPQLNKTTLVGAVAAGVSLAYNTLRHYAGV